MNQNIEIQELERRVKALENTVAQMQQQIAEMPRNIQQQMARTASRRLS